MEPRERDFLGRIVHNAWAREQPRPLRFVPYDELEEADKEADRRIAEAVACALGVDRLMAENERLMASLERQTARLHKEIEELAAQNQRIKHDWRMCAQCSFVWCDPEERMLKCPRCEPILPSNLPEAGR